MKPDQEFERMFRQEFKEITSNLIWKNDSGEYEVFGKYRIISMRPGYKVFCSASEVGIFNSTKSALSWCIADKNQSYNTARELLTVDNKLAALTQDINARATVGDRSKNPALREIILTKLESKIIHKKQLENQLIKCIDWAKQLQSRQYASASSKSRLNLKSS